MQLPRYLILDVDDTLTVDGKLAPEGILALRRASERGVTVVLDTGRSAGWGQALLAYVPCVSAVVVENGGAFWDAALFPGSAEVPVQLLEPDLCGPAVRERLFALREMVARRLGLTLSPAADDLFRLTDHAVVRTVPGGPEGAAILAEVRRLVDEATAGEGGILASSVHIHFFLDGPVRRSKAAGVAALLARRGVPDPDAELARSAVSVGDSGNDASLFQPGRFALSVGVRNIERYLPELGACVPRHITQRPEGLGLAELVDDLLSGRLALTPPC